MKKTAIILTLCMLASLVSCGKADTVEDSKPLDIQKSTVNTTKESQEYESPFKNHSSEDSEPQTTTEISDITADGSMTISTVTTRTGAAVLVRRSTVAAPNIPPSRGTVVIPYASNIVRATKTTAAKTTVTKQKNTNVTQTAAKTSTVTTVVTTTTAPSDVTNGDIICRVQENGVEIIRDGKVVQLIEVDTESMLSFYAGGVYDPSTLITIKDYDFDGYDDLYIPQIIGTLNTDGIYMHYNPESKYFETWEELADIKTYIWIDDDKKLHTTVRGSAVEHENWTYIWNEDKQLKLTGSSLQYAVDEDVFIDYFEYPDGEKTLVRRERIILDDENNIIDTIEVPLNEEPTENPTEGTTE